MVNARFWGVSGVYTPLTPQNLGTSPPIPKEPNILAYQYFGIDLDLVWKAVEQDLPGLKPAIERIYRELEGGV